MSVTIVTLLKRRVGMSVEDFRAYYEENHRRIGEKVVGGYATRYVRRYLTPMDGTDQPFDFDVVTEIDFPDEATRDAFFASIGVPDVAAMIMEDEEKLFDRTRIRAFAVTEAASSLPPVT